MKMKHYVEILSLIITHFIDVGFGGVRPLILVKIEKTWNDANAYCQQEYNSQLGSIRNVDEDMLVYNQIDSQRVVWIGLNDISAEGNFNWIDGYSIGNYRNWAEEEPVKYIFN